LHANKTSDRRRWFASKSVTRDQLLGITRELATLLRDEAKVL